MPDLPPLLKAALQLRAETDLSRLFLPAMPHHTHAARAIREAVDAVFARSPAPPTTEEVAAAVLRAAVATAGLKTPGGGVVLDGNFLLAIAAELEGRQSTSSTH